MLSSLLAFALLAQASAASSAPHARVPAGTPALAASSGCQPTWIPTFGGQVGVSGTVHVLATIDDGSGPALYAGGWLNGAGGSNVSGVAKWNGSAWTGLGAGLTGGNPFVYALAEFDDGSGPALYAGGSFLMAGGQPAPTLARWDGASWSAVGGGTNGIVEALQVFDDGSGPKLYVGGTFVLVGGTSVNGIAAWDGSAWTQVGTPSLAPGSSVYALDVFDDGSGPALYAGGLLAPIGTGTAFRVAKWNGSSWSALAGTMNGNVTALAVYDAGSGPELHAGGKFTHAGGAQVNYVTRWNGSSWAVLQTLGGPSFDVYDLAVINEPGGQALYASGTFWSASSTVAIGVARWDGTSWSGPGGGVGETQVYALGVFDDGAGPALYAGGQFKTASGTLVNNVARWNGAIWSALGKQGLNDSVADLEVFDDGSGARLYACGPFTKAGDVPLNGIGSWSPAGWSALGAGLANGSAATLVVFDDGGGARLYAGGTFTMAGGLPARVARWDGASWAAVGHGPNGPISRLAVHDDGTGAALFACGSFFFGPSTTRTIARWDGATWQGFGGSFGLGFVFDLATYDDGSGPALYAGGLFNSAGGVAANHVARWDGASWSPLGSGTDGYVAVLRVHDDGSGPALYAGGQFSMAGGVATGGVARWDGSAWSSVGSGLSATVLGLEVHDDGSGPALHAVGSFSFAGSTAKSLVAKWDGSNWIAPAGTSFGSGATLASFDDGSESALYVGGDFSASPAGDVFLAKLGCPSVTSEPGCTGNPATLAALAPSAPLGSPLPLQLSGASAANGLALVYFGASGVDASGCGLVLPGLGELLLSPAPAPVLVAIGTLAAGACTLAVPIPGDPSLSGFTAHLQGAAVDVALPSPFELTNGLAAVLGP